MHKMQSGNYSEISWDFEIMSGELSTSEPAKNRCSLSKLCQVVLICIQSYAIVSRGLFLIHFKKYISTKSKLKHLNYLLVN